MTVKLCASREPHVIGDAVVTWGCGSPGGWGDRRQMRGAEGWRNGEAGFELELWLQARDFRDKIFN